MKKNTIILILVLIIFFLIYLLLKQKRQLETLQAQLHPQTEAPADRPPDIERELTIIPDDPGLPAGSNTEIIEHTYYTLSYAEEFEQPEWVSYKLLDDYLTGEKFKRRDNFRADPAVPTGSATPADYKRSGYDRGHLLPAADMPFSRQSMSETFFMSNMSPQKPQFNRGIWKKLEEQVRTWALENEELYVVVGPVLQPGLPKIGKNGVSVPRYYYKVLLDLKRPEIKALGFLMENDKIDGSFFSRAVPIDSIEALTGIDFFPLLPDNLEHQLESTLDTLAWMN